MQAKAAFREAWINAERNGIVAPLGGYVAQRAVQVGSRVQPGQPLLTIIPLHDLWVDANFKESQLRNIRIGQPVAIESDLYGGTADFHGHVVGLAPGTGAAFALLPPQNASGNWIKVVQRVPVRISLDPKELDQHPLRDRPFDRGEGRHARSQRSCARGGAFVQAGGRNRRLRERLRQGRSRSGRDRQREPRARHADADMAEREEHRCRRCTERRSRC